MALVAMSGTTGGRKDSRHGLGHKYSSPSSPLVDALAIDVFSDNQYCTARKYGHWNAAGLWATDQHAHYTGLSCEDVDCMECRAYRLGLDFQGVASCPSLILRMAQDFPDSLGHSGSLGMKTASSHKLGPPSSYCSMSRDWNRGTSYYCPPAVAFVATVPNSDDHELRKVFPRNNAATTKYPRLGSPMVASSAQHRRRDFRKGCSRSSGSNRESYTSASMESGDMWKGSLLWASGTTDSYTSSSAESNTSLSDGPYRSSPGSAFRDTCRQNTLAYSSVHQRQGSPAGFRRKSFLAAVDKSKGDKADRVRRGSYRAAIDPRYLAGHGTLSTDEEHAHNGTSGQGSGGGQGLGQADGRVENKTVTFQLDSDDGRNTASIITAHVDCPGQTSAPMQGSPSSFNRTYVFSDEDNSSSAIPRVEPTCTAEDMPAHFKQRGPVAARAVSVSGDSAPPPTTSSSLTSTATSSTASTLSLTLSSPLTTILVAGSPPPSPRASLDSPVPVAVPSRLARLRQSNLSRKREQMKSTKMPELSEHAETLESDMQGLNTSMEDRGLGQPSSSNNNPLIAVTSSEDPGDESSPDTGSSGVALDRPSSPTSDAVTPSIPDSLLKKLGLLFDTKGTAQPRIDELPEKQLESRFNSLSLAFKTDRLTLEKRLGIQERSRDIAEQNIDKELQGLRDAVELLKQLCGEEVVQDLILKIRHHLDILEQSVARVSSRAEVFGAVQMEKRMCLAMEVMITCTENIRRLRDKEQVEVEEARKVLHEKQLPFGHSTDPFSVAGVNNVKATRRRSEVALPRIFGGSGTPSLHISSSMDTPHSEEMLLSNIASPIVQAVPGETQEPKQRFQSATANISVRNLVTNALRRGTMNRQKSLTQSSSPTSGLLSAASRISSEKKTTDKEKGNTVHLNQESGTFRHGHEEGVKASLTRESTKFPARSEQTTKSSGSSNAHTVQQTPSKDRGDTTTSDLRNEDSPVEEIQSTADMTVLSGTWQWLTNSDWTTSNIGLRKAAAAVICLFAFVIVVVTFMSSARTAPR